MVRPLTFNLPNGTVVHLIGDPHLGKKFEVGVPLARRGERETSQLSDFVQELYQEANIVIMVGDLFDHPYVGYDVSQAAADAVASAVMDRPDVTFVMMAGNHDMPRNITKVGAFDDFRDRLQKRYENLYILNKPAVIDGVACFPWEWNRRADEQVSDLIEQTALAAVGHWDLASFNGKDVHLAPVHALRKAFGDVPLYSGHYHIPGLYGEVICTGSLQPYSHAEDPDGKFYVTLSREEALAAQGLGNKNVRIRLAKGEDMPDIDCLSLTFIREKEMVDEGATPDYTKPTKDWSKMLTAKLAPLDERVRSYITERMSVGTTEE